MARFMFWTCFQQGMSICLKWPSKVCASLTPDHKKVGNWPDPGVCKWNATHRWKALEESYKFASDLIPIQGLSRELWVPKVPGVQTETISGLLLGSPGNKSHLDAGAAKKHREYYMGEGDGFPRVWAVVSQVSPRSPVACPNTKRVQNEF
jgi:hypothetical protein